MTIRLTSHCIYGVSKGRYGIYLRNASGEGNTINSNIINGLPTGTSFSADACIFLRNAQNTLICTNTMDRVKNGLLFNEDCDFTVASKNIIQNHNCGLRIAVDQFPIGPSLIGVQDRFGNRWNENYPGASFAAINEVPSDDVFLSKFLTESPALEITPTDIMAAAPWFEFTGGNKQYCTVTDSEVNYVPSPKELRLVSSTDPQGMSTTVAGYWDMRRQLADKQHRHPGISNTFMQAGNIFSSTNTEGYAKAADVDALFRSLPELQNPYTSALHQLRIDQRNAFEQLELLNAATPLSTEAEFIDESALDAKAVYWEQLQEALKLEQTIQEAIQESYQLQAQAIRATHFMSYQAQYNAPNENAHRVLYDFKLKQLLGTATPADLLAMQNLAYSSDADLGSAVRGARAFLPLCEQMDFLGNAPSVQGLEGLLPAIPTPELVPNVTILAPNPADTELTIGFERPYTGQLRLIAADGRVMKEVEVNERMQIPLDVSSYPAGMYYLSYQDTDGILRYEKLIVQ